MSNISAIHGTAFSQFKKARELICHGFLDMMPTYNPPVFFKFEDDTVTMYKGYLVTEEDKIKDFTKFPFDVPLDVVIDLLWAWLLKVERYTPEFNDFHNTKMFKKPFMESRQPFSIVYTGSYINAVVLTRL